MQHLHQLQQMHAFASAASSSSSSFSPFSSPTAALSSARREPGAAHALFAHARSPAPVRAPALAAAAPTPEAQRYTYAELAALINDVVRTHSAPGAGDEGAGAGADESGGDGGGAGADAGAGKAASNPASASAPEALAAFCAVCDRVLVAVAGPEDGEALRGRFDPVPAAKIELVIVVR